MVFLRQVRFLENIVIRVNDSYQQLYSISDCSLIFYVIRVRLKIGNKEG